MLRRGRPGLPPSEGPWPMERTPRHEQSAHADGRQHPVLRPPRAGQGAQLPVPDRGDPAASTTFPWTRSSARSSRPSRRAGSSRSAARPRSPTASDTYESPDFEETPCVHCAEIRVRGHARSAASSVSYEKPTPESRLTGRSSRSEHQAASSTVAERLGPLHPPPARCAACREQMSDDRRETLGGQAGLADRHRPPAQHRSEPAHPGLAQDDRTTSAGAASTEARDLLQQLSGGRSRGDPDRRREPAPEPRSHGPTFFAADRGDLPRSPPANLTDDEILDRIQQLDQGGHARASVERSRAWRTSLRRPGRGPRRASAGSGSWPRRSIQLQRSTANGLRVAAHPALLHRAARVHQRRQEATSTSRDFFDLVRAHRLPAGQPRQARRQERRPVPGHPDPAAGRRSTPTRSSARSRCPRPGTSRPTASSPSSTHNNLEDVIEQKYKEIESGPPGVPAPRPGLQELDLPAGDRQGPVRGPRRLRRQCRSSSAARACSRTGWARPSPASTRACSWPTRATSSERLEALLDAVAEVYASIFSPDPIEYRAERGLLDFHEEMGVMIQEVVGTRVGKYFFPAYAGVAFSHNEFRWSPRIKREDGLVRLVPGLGTRAVDRVSDDYPVLRRPEPAEPAGQRLDRRGRPLFAQEDRRHRPRGRTASSPRTSASCSTRSGTSSPALTKVFSIYRGRAASRDPWASATDLAKADAVVTFEGLIAGIAVHAPAARPS
ncbi:MAG: hypothetical protein MZV64_33950 [Ignavibacteriales bacterium]|nr:hypothetical protein [Ignavibacteriales bacterium]